MYLSDNDSFIKVVETLEKVMITDHKHELLKDFELILSTEGTLVTLFEFMKLTG